VRIDPLDDRHDRMAFESGVEPLDRYLRTQASQDVRKRVASCFVLTDGQPAPMGYYTLAATSITLTDLPIALSKRLPRYPAVPATLMGRLAVDARYRGQRLGERLLFDAFGRALRSEIATYAFVVDAKDEIAAGFYAAYRFLPLTQAGRRMFVPMTEIARLFT
jgi:GNAT superfamily N-acetyltransferase